MSTEIPFLAIDFGTSFSKIAWFNPKSAQAEIIHTGDGEEKMPSVVFYGDDTEWGKLVGKAADEVLEDYGHDPEVAGRLVDSVKRALLDPPVIALPGGRSVTPVAVVADLLGRLKHDAETRLFHGPVTRAVITHPAVFDPQQQVIRRGAETAGFTQVELVPEPVAAALAFAQAGHKVGDGVLVYDLGAGTFDLAVLARRPGGGFYVRCRWRAIGPAAATTSTGHSTITAMRRRSASSGGALPPMVRPMPASCASAARSRRTCRAGRRCRSAPSWAGSSISA